MDFRIYPLKDTARLPELCELFAKGLAQTTPEQWLWKHYTENGLPEGQILVAEDETGKLRAMFAMQPAWYRRGEERILLVHTEDLVIDPECRGQGLMRKLYDHTMEQYRQQGAAALICFSCNDASWPIFLKYGAQNMGDIGGLATPKTLVPKLPPCRNKDGWEISISEVMPRDLFISDADDVFKMEKTVRTLEWKFTENPEQHYQWLTIRKNGVLMGWIVYYVNKGRLRSAVNICDQELRPEVDAEVLGRAIRKLQSLGNWVTLWGRQNQRDRDLWVQSGMTGQMPVHDHFVFHSTLDRTPPTDWHITKADSDN